MQFKITKDEYEKLDDGTKADYVAKGDGYQLKVEGMPDFDKLLSRISDLDSQVSKVNQQNQTLLEEKRSVQADLDELKTGKARDNKDVDAIEQAWSEKYNNMESQSNEKIQSLTGMVEKLTTGNLATTISAELAVKGSSAALLPHIERRLKTQIDGGEAKTVVVNDDGSVSALTVDELKNEFKNNPVFAPLIAGSSADGGGHQHQNGDGGGSATKVMKRSDFESLPPAQQAAFATQGGQLED